MKQSGKIFRLKKILRGYGSCLIAYSGGVDSTFLACVAAQCFERDKVLAVTATSRAYPQEELINAKRLMRAWHIRHEVLKTHEFRDRSFVRNTPNRCFYCKKELFARLKKRAAQKALAVVAEASTVSDLGDYRPGSRAKRRFGVRSPLVEAGFTKDEVRVFSRRMKLPTWNKPSLACLASRIPYGMPLTNSVLRKVDRAERSLRSLGFTQVRVRHYGNLCRIEVSPQQLNRFLGVRKRIVQTIKKTGYNYVTLDLEGYRSGSMNEVIRRKAP